MSDYFNLYKLRMNISGNTVIESQKSITKHLINDSFQDDLSFTIGVIDGVEFDTRRIKTNNSDINKIHFRPDIIVPKGKIVEIKSTKWLILDFETDDVFPRATIQLCNNTLSIQVGTTRTRTGTDSLGKPIYTDEPIIVTSPCIAQTKIYSMDFNSQINLPKGQIQITVPYNLETKQIREDQTFDMYNVNYKIINTDLTQTIGDSGILVLTAEKVV